MRRWVLAGALAYVAVCEAAALLDVSLGPLTARETHFVVLVAAVWMCGTGAERHTGTERLAWRLMTAAIASWTLGEVYYTQVLWDDPKPPELSPADIGYLAFVPLAVVAIGLLARVHWSQRSVGNLLDGAIVATACGSLCAAIVVESVTAQSATLLSYPICDLVLFGMLVGTLTGREWHVDRSWLLLMAGVLLFFTADSMYVVEVAGGTYAAGGWLDAGWWVGLLLIGLAPHQDHERGRTRRSPAVLTFASPLVTGLIAIGVLTACWAFQLNALAAVLADVALLGVTARLGLAFTERATTLGALLKETVTDALTGLGNRRGFESDLRKACADPGGGWILAIFDLNGFKTYNDTFGHPAGDGLLQRLAARLDAAVDPPGRAFRMGGDEFCVLARLRGRDHERELMRMRIALSEEGDGFTVTAAAGVISLDEGFSAPADALRAADQRMYAEKSGGRLSAPRQSAEVLKRALTERGRPQPAPAEQAAPLAAAVARQLGLPPQRVQDVRLATELRDVGMIAIPDDVLDARGPLTESQWQFIRRHTQVGERIVAAAPALEPVAAIIRASHERWDSTGYPDGLGGDRIPLGARIVAVVDAFDALQRPRPHRPACSAEDAMQELERSAGTLFDPAVVAALAVLTHPGAGVPGVGEAVAH